MPDVLQQLVVCCLLTAANLYCSFTPHVIPQVDAEKRTLIKALPHTLVLHLKRFEWDYETYQRWKVGAGAGAGAGAGVEPACR